MKVIKELPVSVLWTLRMMSIPVSTLNRRKGEEVPVIVSLTSIPSRLKSLHLVIRSLLMQDVTPKKVVLWLHEELEASLPTSLEKLKSDRFEIRYSTLTCSHRKLIHSLEAFPEDVIVTCDDDQMYRADWLSLIYAEHLKNPGKVIGNRTVHINHDPDGRPLPFRQWKYPSDPGAANNRAHTPIGAWGVLYPPHSLSNEVGDSALFLELAPRADDLWFKAMSLLKGTISIPAAQYPKEPVPIAGTQKEALKKENLREDKNTVQWQALEDRFGLSGIILGSDPGS